ncbi:MAG: hypothetical protein U0703_27585 [Anaerolineae bacterium]
MLPALKPGGLILVGEAYWIETPPDEAYAALGVGRDDYVSLIDTLDRIHSAGLGWSRWCWRTRLAGIATKPRWWALYEWLRCQMTRSHRKSARRSRETREHLTYQRRYFGWGVFVMRER